MRIALMIEGQEGVTWDEWVALARTCEEHGIGDLFRSDHYVGLMGDETRGATDAWALISALGAVTSTLRLGTLVSPVTFRHPAVLAKMAATADNVTGGRIQVGIGAGWNEREHAAFGFDFPDVATRYELLSEQVEIVRRLLTEETVSFSGKHYTLDDVRPLPRPVQDPVPLLMGGKAGPQARALAVRFADEYNSIGAGFDELPERLANLDAACEEAGRDPASLARSMMTVGIVGTTEDELLARTGALMERVGVDGDPAAFLAERSDRWIAGTVEQVGERLAELEDLGLSRVMLQHLVHDDLEMVALLGDEFGTS
jgi:F420-dependent oxidoreductase-like protein